MMQEQEISDIICLICSEPIDLERDNYVKVEDYKEGKFFMVGYYHNPCWHNAMHKETVVRLGSAAKKAMELIKKKKTRLYEEA